jgi:hypothetical protein
MSNNCTICCEKYNKSSNAKIICNITNCNFEACKTCTRTYLLNTTNDPHCMNCKNPWTTEFLIENLNKSYMENDYKKHRKQLLLDKAISKTPELMNLAEQSKLIDIEKEKMDKLTNELKEVKKVYNELLKNIQESRLKIYRLRSGEDTETSDRKKFIMPCPSNNCKGYLSTQYKCNLCELYTCPDCFDILSYNKTDHHTCKEDNLKSAQLIKKETKGCPKCGVRIFKISGCDQMWCTECKVAFSWNTGKIVLNGSIHNPHYYQYMQNTNVNNPRNPGDIICGGLINHYDLQLIKNYLYNITKNITINKSEHEIIIKELTTASASGPASGSSRPTILKSILENKTSTTQPNILLALITLLNNLHRTINHITNVDLINCRRKVREFSNHDHLTIEYILNKKTKDELSTCILRNDNLRKKNTELLNIYELLSVVGIERFNNILNYYTTNNIELTKATTKTNTKTNTNSTTKTIIEFLNLIINSINEINETINMTNDVLKQISYNYNMTVTIINYDPKQYNYNSTSKKFNQQELKSKKTKTK